MPEFEPIVGRSFKMTVAGDDCRIYVEEAGRGIPLVCLHTAGADARQYRHLMCIPRSRTTTGSSPSSASLPATRLHRAAEIG